MIATGTYKRFEYDKAGHKKAFRKMCEDGLKGAVKAYIGAILLNVPSYSGTARGTLLKLAEFSGANLPIPTDPGAQFTWRFSRKTKRPFILKREPDPKKGEDAGDRKSKLVYVNTKNEIGIEITNRLLEYRINDFLNMRDRDPLHFGQLKSDLPWQSLNAGRTAWNRYVRTIPFPNVQKFLTLRTIKVR
jgi:hypothetical protein